MKTLLKVVLYLVLLVAVVAAAGVGYFYWRYPSVPPAETVTVQATPEKIARGEYLVNHVTECVMCHSIRDMTKYAGPVKPGTEGGGGEFFGDEAQGFLVYSKNITPEGIGAWSDGELIRAMTTGVTATGEPLFPIMPYTKYGAMAREDVESIVAYIRTLTPVRSSVPARTLPFPLPIVVRTMPQPAAFTTRPPSSDRVAYGKYLVNAAVCADCHTPTDDRGMPLAGREFSGGMAFPLPGGGIVRSANITPEADTGIGTWTEDAFLQKFAAFRGTEPRALSAAEQRENTMMPWGSYSGMTDEDLRAIYAYLRTLKPVVNQVRKFN
jgi:mono/diheme cytochrome c family protein